MAISCFIRCIWEIRNDCPERTCSENESERDYAVSPQEGRIRKSLSGKAREFRILTSVSGIGFIGASTLIAEIDNISITLKTPTNSQNVGLTPSVYRSANVTHTGSITKYGSRHLRWILVELAHIAIQSLGQIRSFFEERLMPKKGYKKAIVAVARKVLRIIWHLLVNDELFADDTTLRFKQVKLPKLPKSVQNFWV